MDITAKLSKKQKITIGVAFLIAALIILYIFPGNAKFEYQFERNSIWNKETLTSPMYFMINKNQETLKAETDSMLHKLYQPYFNISDHEREQAISRLTRGSGSASSDVADAYTKHIKTWLFNIYQNGIMSADDYERFKDSVKKVRIKSDDQEAAVEVSLSRVYTPKSAYEQIIKKAPASLDKDILTAYNIDRLLSPNLTYDEKSSLLSREDLISKNICTTKGFVQEGEIIVSHGEKITDEIFDKLKSLELTIEKEGNNSHGYLVKSGQGVIVLIALATFYLYLILFRKKFACEMKNVIFMLSMIFCLCLLTSLVVKHYPDLVYIIPYAILPIIITTFFDTRTALFMHNTTVLICSFIVHEGVEFLLMQVVIGMLTICILKDLFQRSQLIVAAAFIGLTYCMIYIGSTLIYTSKWEKLEMAMLLEQLLPFVLNALLLLFAYPLIYIIEKAWGYVSDVTLVELANTNNPLLLQFSEVAPGSFQHSMQVSNLAAAAASVIGANPMLVRTGALYHDIGKMRNPAFFTENQNGVNPHDELANNEQSAQIIISHVKDGLEIANHNGLPEKVKLFIRTHHGTNQAKYFYVKALQQNPDEEIDKDKFTYPGPLPSSKETAILMMCDAVEAASRSLKEYTDESISTLVSNIIDGQIADGAFRDAPITFKNIEEIKLCLIEKLKSLYHTRISYPTLK